MRNSKNQPYDGRSLRLLQDGEAENCRRDMIFSRDARGHRATSLRKVLAPLSRLLCEQCLLRFFVSADRLGPRVHRRGRGGWGVGLCSRLSRRFQRPQTNCGKRGEYCGGTGITITVVGDRAQTIKRCPYFRHRSNGRHRPSGVVTEPPNSSEQDRTDDQEVTDDGQEFDSKRLRAQRKQKPLRLVPWGRAWPPFTGRKLAVAKGVSKTWLRNP